MQSYYSINHIIYYIEFLFWERYKSKDFFLEKQSFTVLVKYLFIIKDIEKILKWDTK